MPVSKIISEHKGALSVGGATVAGMLGILAYLNNSYTSFDKHDGHVTSFNTHVAEYVSTKDTASESLDKLTNRMKKELKQNRIDDLVFQKRLLIAKGKDDLTTYDETVLSMIQLEIDTLNGK